MLLMVDIVPICEKKLSGLDRSGKLFELSPSELDFYGCRNCLWCLHGQCSVKHPPICPAYTDFLYSFVKDSRSISDFREKFQLYLSHLQSLRDYRSYLETLSSGVGNKDLLRMWWERLNETVLRSYGRICDRESRERSVVKGAGILATKDVNFNVMQVSG